MYGFWDRAGLMAITAALLFAALRVHKSTGRPRVTKLLGVALSFLAGLTLLATIVGSWLGGLINLGVGFAVGGLIVIAAIVLVDLHDGRPDKPAFWAAFFLALFMVLGIGQIPAVGQQIGNGGKQVQAQFQQHGKPASHPPAKKPGK